MIAGYVRVSIEQNDPEYRRELCRVSGTDGIDQAPIR
jgi:hypothetical protein